MSKPEANKPNLVFDTHSEDEETISGDQLFNDLMAGFEEAIQATRGEKELRTTYVSSPADRSYVSFYDSQRDELYIQVSREKIAARDESLPGVALEYDAQGKLVGMRLSDASVQFAAFPLGAGAEKTAA